MPSWPRRRPRQPSNGAEERATAFGLPKSAIGPPSRPDLWFAHFFPRLGAKASEAPAHLAPECARPLSRPSGGGHLFISRRRFERALSRHNHWAASFLFMAQAQSSSGRPLGVCARRAAAEMELRTRRARRPAGRLAACLAHIHHGLASRAHWARSNKWAASWRRKQCARQLPAAQRRRRLPRPVPGARRFGGNHSEKGRRLTAGAPLCQPAGPSCPSGPAGQEWPASERAQLERARPTVRESGARPGEEMAQLAGRALVAQV